MLVVSVQRAKGLQHSGSHCVEVRLDGHDALRTPWVRDEYDDNFERIDGKNFGKSGGIQLKGDPTRYRDKWIHFTLVHQRLLRQDKRAAEAHVAFSAVASGRFSGWITLEHKNRYGGQLHIDLRMQEAGAGSNQRQISDNDHAANRASSRPPAPRQVQTHQPQRARSAGPGERQRQAASQPLAHQQQGQPQSQRVPQRSAADENEDAELQRAIMESLRESKTPSSAENPAPKPVPSPAGGNASQFGNRNGNQAPPAAKPQAGLPAPNIITVQVPPGGAPGATLRIDTASGPMHVVVPDGVREGQTFQVQLAATAPQPRTTPPENTDLLSLEHGPSPRASRHESANAGPWGKRQESTDLLSLDYMPTGTKQESANSGGPWATKGSNDLDWLSSAFQPTPGSKSPFGTGANAESSPMGGGYPGWPQQSQQQFQTQQSLTPPQPQQQHEQQQQQPQQISQPTSSNPWPSTSDLSWWGQPQQLQQPQQPQQPQQTQQLQQRQQAQPPKHQQPQQVLQPTAFSSNTVASNPWPGGGDLDWLTSSTAASAAKPSMAPSQPTTTTAGLPSMAPSQPTTTTALAPSQPTTATALAPPPPLAPLQSPWGSRQPSKETGTSSWNAPAAAQPPSLDRAQSGGWSSTSASTSDFPAWPSTNAGTGDGTSSWGNSNWPGTWQSNSFTQSPSNAGAPSPSMHQTNTNNSSWPTNTGNWPAMQSGQSQHWTSSNDSWQAQAAQAETQARPLLGSSDPPSHKRQSGQDAQRSQGQIPAAVSEPVKRKDSVDRILEVLPHIDRSTARIVLDEVGSSEAAIEFLLSTEQAAQPTEPQSLPPQRQQQQHRPEQQQQYQFQQQQQRQEKAQPLWPTQPQQVQQQQWQQMPQQQRQTQQFDSSGWPQSQPQPQQPQGWNVGSFPPSTSERQQQAPPELQPPAPKPLQEWTPWPQFFQSASRRFPPGNEPGGPAGSADVQTGVQPAPLGTPVEATGRRKALLVGINYFGTNAELRGCLNDVTNLSEMLVRLGYQRDWMLKLVDDDQNPMCRPTKRNILLAMAWLVDGVAPGDVLFFHFSGHGAQQEDPHGVEEDAMDETICPEDFESADMISDNQIFSLLVKSLPSGVRLTALMDCCHSGTGMDLPFSYDVPGRRWVEETNPHHSLGDVVLFSGCQDEQCSADAMKALYNAPGGAMTTAFIESIKGIAARRAGAVTYPELIDQIRENLRRGDYEQIPNFCASQPFDLQQRPFKFFDVQPNLNAEIGLKFTKKHKPRRKWFSDDPLAQMLGIEMAFLVGIPLAMMAAPLAYEVASGAGGMAYDVASGAGGMAYDTASYAGGAATSGAYEAYETTEDVVSAPFRYAADTAESADDYASGASESTFGFAKNAASSFATSFLF